MRRKKTTDQDTEEKWWVFSFDLKEESEDECLTESGREFQITGRSSTYHKMQTPEYVAMLTVLHILRPFLFTL